MCGVRRNTSIKEMYENMQKNLINSWGNRIQETKDDFKTFLGFSGLEI